MSNVAPTTWPRVPRALALGAMAAATFALSALSLASPLEQQGTALFWLGAGLSLGVLIMLPPRRWPWLLGAVFAACLLSNATHAIPWGLNLAFALTNVLEPALAAWLFCVWRDRAERSLVAQAIVLALVAALGALLGACVGTAALLAAGRSAEPLATFGLWFVDDLLGALVVAPLVVAWWPRSPWLVARSTRRFWLELCGFAAVVLAAGLLSFWRTTPGSLASVVLYAQLAVLLFGAVRLGPRGATVGSLCLSVCAVLGTLRGYGPFVTASADVIQQATALQGYLAVTALVGLVPAMLIAERTRVAEALRLREREIEAIFQSLGDAVIVTDQALRVRYANRAAEQLSGFERSAMLGRPLAELITLEQSTDAQDVARQAVEQASVVRSAEPNRLLRADGTERWTSLTGAPLKDEAGQVRGAAVVLSDETERRAHTAKLREAERQLVHSQKLQAIGELAAGVAHDFNNILTVITASAEILRMDVDATLQPLVEDVLSACSRAARLTTQLLVFNRKDSFEVAAVDLNELTRGLSGMLRRLLGEDIALDVQLGETAQTVLADRGQLEQIVLNLAVNARDAMPVGGHLTIKVSRADPEPDAAATPGASYVLLEVQDTGHGIDGGTLERIFEPFFTTKPVGAGTGLGLATVHGICARHQGFVRVSSKLGEGACFRVFLPLADQAALAAAQAEEAPRQGRGEHILLVEDNVELRELVQKLLTRAGFQVTLARDPLSALQLLSARRCDLLLSDVVMPDMNGRELATRARKVTPGLPVLFMSGYSAGVLEQRVSGLQGFRLLRKPFSATALMSAVSTALHDADKGSARSQDSRAPARA